MSPPVDKNPLDLRQAFVAIVEPLGPWHVKFRLGRQEMAFDLQRFISVRDGPNVRQAFDAIWADYETGPWRWIAYATQPVQYRDNSDFDDVSNRHLTFSGVRVERKAVGPGDLSAYYSRYNRSNAHFLDATGDEHRDVFDARYSGTVNHVDWDVETMYQSGHVGTKTIGAWAVGSLAGYTFASTAVDTARRSAGGCGFGRHPSGRWPRRHLQSALSERLLLRARGLHRLYEPDSREAVADQSSRRASSRCSRALACNGARPPPTPSISKARRSCRARRDTASRWTGFYTQLRADWAVTANLAAALEAVHFQVGPSLRELGARNADYVGAELKFGW